VLPLPLPAVTTHNLLLYLVSNVSRDDSMPKYVLLHRAIKVSIIFGIGRREIRVIAKRFLWIISFQVLLRFYDRWARCRRGNFFVERQAKVFDKSLLPNLAHQLEYWLYFTESQRVLDLGILWAFLKIFIQILHEHEWSARLGLHEASFFSVFRLIGLQLPTILPDPGVPLYFPLIDFCTSAWIRR